MMRGATGRWARDPFPSNSEDRPGTPSRGGLGHRPGAPGHRHCGLWHSQVLQSPHCRFASAPQPAASQVGRIQPSAANRSAKQACKFELSGVPELQSRAERVSVTVGRLRRRGGSRWSGGGFGQTVGLSRADDDGRCRWGTDAAVVGNTGTGVGIGGSWCSIVVPRLSGRQERPTRGRASEVIEPSWCPPEDIGEVQWGEDQALGYSGDEPRFARGGREQLRGVGLPFGMGVYPLRPRPTCPL